MGPLIIVAKKREEAAGRRTEAIVMSSIPASQLVIFLLQQVLFKVHTRIQADLQKACLTV